MSVVPPSTIADVERGLRGPEQLGLWGRVAREHAAVAAVLRDRGSGLELLLVRRSEFEGDPWSGHVSLPGGLQEATDWSLEQTARRETAEEISLDLDHTARLLGRMSIEVSKTKRGMGLMAIHPIVFALDPPDGDPALVPSDEVRRTFWMPLDEVASGRHDAIRPWQAFGFQLRMPAWRWDGEIVWGITHRIVSRLIALATP